MKSSSIRKVGVAVILVLTSLALIIPSVAILFNIYQSFSTPQQPIQIDPSQITIETMAPKVTNN